jgi:formylglycine-generating enzyme required for sulfatase activity
MIESFAECCQDEPYEEVSVPGFWIDKHEVTNAEYSEFLGATNYPRPPHWTNDRPPPGQDDHPVTRISHADALAFADWAQKQLPTVAQWTRAYRGSDDRMYPWGDEWVPERVNDGRNVDFPVGTSPVDSSLEDVTQFGVVNMVGNVSEMMRDQRIIEGEKALVTKGAHSEASGDVFGAAPIQVFHLGGTAANDLTGFRCVIEEDDLR